MKKLLLTFSVFCVTIHAGLGDPHLLTQQPQYQAPTELTTIKETDIENQLSKTEQLRADHVKLQKQLIGIKKQLNRMEGAQAINFTMLTGAVFTSGVCALWLYNLAVQNGPQDYSN
jgi:hypothetical protein